MAYAAKGGFVQLASTAAEPVYRPIAGYGAIGEGRSVALVAEDGSIDWWCPGRFDAPSVFAAILDGKEGGSYRLQPADRASSRMRYIDDTNVLETIHETSSGSVRVVDFAAWEEDTGLGDSVLVRRVTGLSGSLDMIVDFAPRFHYGRARPLFTVTPAGLLASGAGEIMLLRAPLSWARLARSARHARFTIRAGETVDLVLRHAHFASPVPFADAIAHDPATLEALTIQRWRAWAERTQFDGPHAALVRRSALALKLLQYRRNGAFVAAATTSLPEAIGGVRNWDYRYTWVRDGALTARALHDLGFREDADAFAAWLRATVGDDVDAMRIMYTLSGSDDLPEREIPHLEGYRRSAPVRIGNGAARQRQLDVYGELIEFLHTCRALRPGAAWPLVAKIADWVVAHWREPDSGIWEIRAVPRHFVLSKAMAWVALERATSYARELGHEPPATWRETAAAIREEVLARGYDEERGAFVQAYGMKELDASNLLLPLIGFIDARDPRMVGTVDRTLEELTTRGLVYRYLGADDGLPGEEATFAYCTFWLVEVLARQGRAREARAIFDGIVARASPLGLFAEEIDAATGEHLGNYPQAFPHAGLIQAARALREADAVR